MYRQEIITRGRIYRRLLWLGPSQLDTKDFVHHACGLPLPPAPAPAPPAAAAARAPLSISISSKMPTRQWLSSAAYFTWSTLRGLADGGRPGGMGWQDAARERAETTRGTRATRKTKTVVIVVVDADVAVLIRSFACCLLLGESSDNS